MHSLTSDYTTKLLTLKKKKKVLIMTSRLNESVN